MPTKDDGGLGALMKKFERVQMAPAEKIDAALLRSAKRVQRAQQAAAPKDTGALAASIVVTAPGQTTPAHSQPGGNTTAGKHEVLVTAGNSEVRYPHLVEFGTAKTDAQPFFLNTFHAARAREQKNIDRAGRKAIRDAWNGRGGSDD